MTAEENSPANDARAHLKDAARSLIAAARAALDVAENLVENPPNPPGRPRSGSGASPQPGVQRIRVQPDDGGGGAEADVD